MQSTLTFPSDLLSIPASKKMRETLGGVGDTLLIWWELFQQLKYRAEEGQVPGRLARLELPNVVKALAEQVPGASEALLLDAKVLLPDGEEYVCPRFASLHGGSVGGRSNAQRGGDMRAFDARMKKAEGSAFQQSLHISESKLKDEEGQPLEADLVRRVTRLVVATDNALFRPNRPPILFTEGLIQDALQVARKLSDEEITYVCRIVAKHRSHPALNGMTTERLLLKFEEIVKTLE
jgi:hypothetical protein